MKRLSLYSIFSIFFLVSLTAKVGLSQDPVIFGVTTHILQDFLDNYEQAPDLGAGGSYRDAGFGEFGSRALETDGSLVNSGLGALRLETDADGFDTSVFVGVTKDFEDASGNPVNIDITTANVLSYFARGDANADTSPLTIHLEFIIGDAGDAAGETGSVWQEINPTTLTGGYQRIFKPLDEENFAVTGGTVNPTPDFDLSNVTGFNIVVLREDGQPEAGVQRTTHIDDIVVFNNPRTLEITQSEVFVPSNGVAQATITATVSDDGSPLVDPTTVDLLFTIENAADTGGAEFVDGGGASLGTSTVVTTTNGVASATYRAGTNTATVAEISVNEN